MGTLLTAFIGVFILNSYANQIFNTLQKIALLKPMSESCHMRLQWFYLSCFFFVSDLCTRLKWWYVFYFTELDIS